MIGLLRGQILECQPTRALLDVQGVGYEVFIPISTYELISKATEPVSLFTYLHVREDALQLYGFASQGEKLLFQKIISVSGIGPKVALGILSRATVEDFMQIVRTGDITRLRALPGVGKKTAERLVLELRDKLGGELVGDDYVAVAAQSSTIDEALMALMSLGYARANVEKVLHKISQGDDTQDVESLVKTALRHL